MENKSKKGKESMVLYFVLCKHVLEDKHISSVKEEDNSYTLGLAGCCGMLEQAGFRMVKSSVWKTRLLSVPNKIPFQTSHLKASNSVTAACLAEEKHTSTCCLKGTLSHRGVAVPHAKAHQCPKSD